MKRKHFPAEQIVSVLKQAELGMAVGDIVRQLGISEQTFLPLEEAVRKAYGSSKFCRTRTRG